VVQSLCQPLVAKEARSRLLTRSGGGGGVDAATAGVAGAAGAAGSSTCVPSQNSLDSSAQAEEYRSNADFTSRFRRLNARPPIFASDAPADGGLKESIVRGRVLVLEATIVRVLKARKVLLYAQLCALVQEALSNQFAPSLTDIKKRVESLIDREFLERRGDPANSSIAYCE
jgi:Cullin protein neddylation domain